MSRGISAVLTESEVKEYRALMDKTNTEKPSASDVKALQRFFKQHPELWCVVGNAAHSAAMHLLEDGIKTTLGNREALKASWDGVKDELGYPDAPTLERLLIEQVALCWLRLNLLEQGYTNATMGSSRASYASLNYWERRLSAAQRRYLRACETLARVRKLARNTPALQVNIAAEGGQQVNVAGEMEVKRGGNEG